MTTENETWNAKALRLLTWAKTNADADIKGLTEDQPAWGAASALLAALDAFLAARPPTVEPIKLALKAEAKVGIPNSYSSATAEVFLSGLTADHTDEDIERLMGRGRVAYDKMVAKLKEDVAAVCGVAVESPPPPPLYCGMIRNYPPGDTGPCNLRRGHEGDHDWAGRR